MTITLLNWGPKHNLINITRDTFMISSFWKSQDMRSSVPETEMKTKICISYYTTAVCLPLYPALQKLSVPRSLWSGWGVVSSTWSWDQRGGLRVWRLLLFWEFTAGVTMGSGWHHLHSAQMRTLLRADGERQYLHEPGEASGWPFWYVSRCLVHIGSC